MEFQERMKYNEIAKKCVTHPRLNGWIKMHELKNEHVFGWPCFQAG
jgi:hypothetical protein